VIEDPRRIATDFDLRSANYSKNHWHRAYADGLIAQSAIRFRDRVLDAGVGTGFAAIAAAARVGPEGLVVGVDVSPGMLQQAQLAIDAAELGNIELLQADAAALPGLADESFDAVVCSAALLYMPVQRALTEWNRLLRPGGTIAFSTMRAGFPRAGQLFRDCAAELGVQLTDPSAALGSESAAAAALRQAGFTQIVVVADSVRLVDVDFACAWESNLRSAAHGEVRSLPPADLESLQLQFEHALDNRRRVDPGFGVAQVLYALGVKPDRPHV
jgi:ubiquinone/menaquinone biosynthesis C-methylase UbiE